MGAIIISCGEGNTVMEKTWQTLPNFMVTEGQPKKVFYPCNSIFQDKEYGKNQRVASVSASKTEATCTVCGKVHLLRNAKIT